MHFESVLPVLQGVGHSGSPVGQPALFADRHQHCPKVVGNRCGKQKPAGLYAQHDVDLVSGEAVREAVHGVPEGVGRGQQRGDVPEEYSFHREVWNVSDIVYEVQLALLLNRRHCQVRPNSRSSWLELR